MMDHYIFLLLGLLVLGSIIYSIIITETKEKTKIPKRKSKRKLKIKPETEETEETELEPERPELEQVDEVPKIILPQIRIISKTKTELTNNELEELRNLYIANFPGKQTLDDSLKTNSRIFIAYDDNNNNIVGQAAILVLDQHDIWGAFSAYRNVNVDTNTLILYNVCVDRSIRRQGVGKHLLNAVHQWGSANNRHTIVLFVDPNNATAINLYKNFGYIIDKSHYAPPPAEMMMRLKLTDL